MDDLVCDVCGREATGVASSSLGGISFAYCQECLDRGAEPLPMWHNTIWCVGGWHQIRTELVLSACSWFQDQYVGWATIVSTYREDEYG